MPERLIKKDAKMLFAELYQICGALGCNAKILDNLSAASRGLKPPHKTLLPFVDRESVPAETLVMLNFADIEKIYENNNIPMDADAIGLQPLYYSWGQLTKFIEELNFYLEKVER